MRRLGIFFSKKKQMNSRLSILILAVVFGHSIKVFAQNEDDALRYSRLQYGGTARTIGLGGSFGALGADFSSLSTNPAGIGLYRRSEITFTPQVFFRNTSSGYLGNNSEDSRYAFNFQNFGLVFNGQTRHAKKDTKGWKSFSFGIGMNRIADFNTRTIASGRNGSGSFLDSFTASAQGKETEQFDRFTTQMAYQTYLINPINDSLNPNQYFSVMPAGINKQQTKSTSSTGGINETAISFGGNYNNFLFWGATIGVSRIRYNHVSDFEERDIDDSVAVDNFVYAEEISTRGSGTNLKVGIIVMPMDWFRIGAAVHTPTFYQLSETFDYSMSSSFDDGNNYSFADNGSFDYNLRTPFRASGSLAIIIGKMGLVTGDVEFVDYRDASLRAVNYSFLNENAATATKYGAATNFRAGTEWKIDRFSLRGGYAYMASPFSNKAWESATQTYSIGAGYRDEDFFIDLAYYQSSMNRKIYLYDGDFNSNQVSEKLTWGGVVATLGFKF
jgi:hypothetical protein